MRYITTAERIGIEKGVIQGRMEGRVEGESTMLLRQLKHKVGQLSPSYRTKVKAADPKTLLQWGDRILDAETLQEMFRES